MVTCPHKHLVSHYSLYTCGVSSYHLYCCVFSETEKCVTAARADQKVPAILQAQTLPVHYTILSTSLHSSSLVTRHLLHSSGHAGVQGMLIHCVKNEVDQALNVRTLTRCSI